MNHNTLKISIRQSLKLLAFSLLPALTAFTNQPAITKAPLSVAYCQAPEPSRTGQTPGSNTYSWSSVPGATQYAVWYVRKSDGFTSSVSYVNGNSYTFSGLSSGNYAFCFATVCNNGISDFVIIEDIIVPAS